MHAARPDLEWICTNWHDGTIGDLPQETRAVNERCDESVPIRWYQANVERDPLPFASESFDAVVYCEVLEHLVEDPAARSSASTACSSRPASCC